jgi:hypothetical protein
MSYFRRGLSGVQSQPQGGRVSRSALSGVQSRPSGGRVARSALGLAVVEGKAIVKQIVTRPERPPPPPPPPPPSQVMAGRGRTGPRWYRQLAGTTLGADEAPGHTLAGSTLSEPEATRKFREDLLTGNRALLEQERERARKEDLRGYLQIGATLMIPVAAAIWRSIGVGKKKKVSGP